MYALAAKNDLVQCRHLDLGVALRRRFWPVETPRTTPPDPIDKYVLKFSILEPPHLWSTCTEMLLSGISFQLSCPCVKDPVCVPALLGLDRAPQQEGLT
jgi:hypothetical protein